MENQEHLTTDETLAEKYERLQKDFKDTARRTEQFSEFLAYFRQMAIQAYKLTSEGKLRISSLLSILPSTHHALGANNGWIMGRRSGRSGIGLSYKIIIQYINGDDAERIRNLKPWTDESLQNIAWSMDPESNLPRPALLSPEDARPLIEEVLSTQYHLIIARFELGGMDYLLVFSAPQSPDARAPFDSYHQSFLTTVVCFIKAAYAIGEADGEANKERELAEERWREAQKGDSRTAIAKAAQVRLRQEAPSDKCPKLPPEFDETCADYIEYWRQKLALPSWRRRGVAGVLSERVKDIVDTIEFPLSEEDSYVMININVDIEKSASQKAPGNVGKWLKVGSECQRTIGAVARAFCWAEASLKYTSKDQDKYTSKAPDKKDKKDLKYRDWIENGQRVLKSFSEQDETLRQIFKENANV